MNFILQLETVDDDAVEIVETETIVEADMAKKRKTESTEDDSLIKKRKVDVKNGNHNEKDVFTVESDSDDEPQNDVTIEKVCSRKHKASTDDECSIIYDDTNNTTSAKKAKSSN